MKEKGQTPFLQRQTVSACLIVRDEEERLPGALASVAFCDEIVVVDSGSADQSREIARAAGAVVVENPWPGFAAQRNVALDHATSDWVLEVDADERVTEQLRDEILTFLSMPPPADIDIAVMPRRNRFLGRALGPSAKYPEYRERLVRRGSQRHDESRLVHEGLEAHGRVWALRGDLEHELAGSWREALADTWAYARLESGHVAPAGSPVAYAKAIVARPLAKAAYRLLIDGGWRDGAAGVARIALDATGDAVIWARRATGRVPVGGTQSAQFGHVLPRVGPVRIAAIAYGDAERERALAWLRAARAAGADVALVTDADTDGGDWLHVAPLPRPGPVHLVRALDGVVQMRPVDGLLLAGRRAERHARLLPSHLRGPGAAVTPADDPAASVEALYRSVR